VNVHGNAHGITVSPTRPRIRPPPARTLVPPVDRAAELGVDMLEERADAAAADPLLEE